MKDFEEQDMIRAIHAITAELAELKAIIKRIAEHFERVAK